MFFLILKEGGKVQQLQLEDFERLDIALALYLVIAWRINRLTRLGRTLPDIPADAVFEQDEWHVVFILNEKPIPKQVSTLNTVVRLIAQRSGVLGRKGDGEPGALPGKACATSPSLWMAFASSPHCGRMTCVQCDGSCQRASESASR